MAVSTEHNFMEVTWSFIGAIVSLTVIQLATIANY